MKILLASKYGPHGRQPIGGVQTWVATVADELIRVGHAVTLAESGQQLPARAYFDIGLIANWGRTSRFAQYCDRVLQVSHGIIPDEEPSRARVTYTSEEIRDHWGIPGGVTRQPIDTTFWSPADVPLGPLVWHSYRRPLPWLPQLAEQLGVAFVAIKNKPPQAVRDQLQRAYCVLATGRAAVEAMSCGVPVVICDHRAAYQGPLYDPDTLGSMRRNYSGRGGVAPTLGTLKSAIIRATKGRSLRPHVLRHHNVKRIAQNLIREAML